MNLGDHIALARRTFAPKPIPAPPVEQVVVPVGLTAPYGRYIDDSVGFGREVLGMDPWERPASMPPEYASQADVLRAIGKHRRVADKSGQKTGKSSLGAVTALWWMYSRVQGCVTLTAPSSHQVESILWKEIRLIAQGQHPAQRAKGFRPKLPGINGEPGGRLYMNASGGLWLGDGWGIAGVTTDKPERMQGGSGSQQLYIVDEASGYPEDILQAVLGNLGGGGSILLLGNPTQLSGTFYDAFHGKAEAWVTFTQSSLHNPNFYGASVDGLADEEYAKNALIDWGGPGNPLYDARVLGRFPSAGEQVVVPLALVEAGKARWATTPDEGRLELGLDPARGGGDDAILVPRRGLRVGMACPIPVDASNTVTPPGHQVGLAVIRYVAQHRRGAEVPRVKVDAIGIGSSVVDFLWAHVQACKAEGKPVPFEVVAVVSSQAASEYIQVRPGASAKDEFENLRTQLGFGVTEFLHKGGALPEDGKLQAELVAAKYAFTGRGKRIMEAKDEIKKRLRRSPDRADAASLAIYEPPGSNASETKPPPITTFQFGGGAGGMGW